MGKEGLGNCGFEKEAWLKAVTLKERDVLKNNADQLLVGMFWASPLVLIFKQVFSFQLFCLSIHFFLYLEFGISFPAVYKVFLTVRFFYAVFLNCIHCAVQVKNIVFKSSFSKIYQTTLQHNRLNG